MTVIITLDKQIEDFHIFLTQFVQHVMELMSASKTRKDHKKSHCTKEDESETQEDHKINETPMIF